MQALIIRHAETTGQDDTAPLTEMGQAQAEALAMTLIDHTAGPLYSSPLRRAMATIEPYAVKTGQPVIPLPGLSERLLAPQPLADWRSHIARSFDDPLYAPEGGESHADLCKRAAPELTRVLRTGGPNPVILSHGNLIAALFAQADPSFGYADWQDLRNPDLFSVTLDEGRISGFARIDLRYST